MICSLCGSDVSKETKIYCQQCKVTRSKYEKTINDNLANPNANLEQVASNEQVGKNEGSPSNSRVRISCTSHRKRLADFDGVSYKAAIDGLKAIGVLKDDSTQYVSEEATVNQKKAVGDEYTVIEIWEE
jgi:hypothetical protein